MNLLNLSEFLKAELEKEYAPENVINILRNCDSSFALRMLQCGKEEEDRLHYFFKEDGAVLIENEEYGMLKELWNTIEPYIWDYQDGQTNDIWLIQIIQEVETARLVNRYNGTIDCCSKEFRHRLAILSEALEDISCKCYIAEVADSQVQALYPLKQYKEQCYHIYREYVQLQLIRMMREGGDILVIPYNIGQQPGKKYILDKEGWEESPVSEGTVRGFLKNMNSDAKRNGILMGFVSGNIW